MTAPTSTNARTSCWPAAADHWQMKSLELGIRYERTVEGFWADLLKELPGE